MKLLNSTRKLLGWAVKHKFWSVLIVAAVLYSGYSVYQKNYASTGETKYVISAVRIGSVSSTVSGSGQVSASDQIDVKPKASGEIVYISAKEGSYIGQGAIIAKIDSKNADKAVRDAEVNLDSAKLSREKLVKPADQLSTTQAENSLAKAIDNKKQAEDDLQKAYDDGFNDVANAYLDLPGVMTGLQDTLYTTNTSIGTGGQWNIDFYYNAILQYNDKAVTYRDDVNSKYQKAKASYDKAFTNYKATTRSSSPNEITNLITESYNATRDIAEAVKSTNNLIQLYKNELTDRNIKPNTTSDTHLLTLNGYTSKTNTHLSTLLSANQAIDSEMDAITNAERTITENTQSLQKLRDGADSLDIKSADLTIKQRENSLLDAKQNLDDYYVRAPFGGVVAKINLKKGDTASTGSAAATMVSMNKIVEVILNEVDLTGVSAGKKAELTFDAIPNLTVDGVVQSVDSIGTVSQGVVTYTVKLSLDTQDTRIKTNMSASAKIITSTRKDVLVIPTTAIKSRGNRKYVELVTPQVVIPQNRNVQAVSLTTLPTATFIETGLAGDIDTEIISGLKEGDQIVVRTITPTSGAITTQQAPSLFGNIGGSGNRTFQTGGGSRQQGPGTGGATKSTPSPTRAE
ncbi:MAG: HlyD family efflux transporter periplasmic adaptor subunit [Candidatus Vogelbacteria bacterium]|nr:HlyD family efflux transporter periplasmic adaptor subunit [Candidatus Vogelbacteria bacterium]